MSSPPKEWINLVKLVICGAQQRNAQVNVCNASGFKSNDVVSMRKMAFAKTCFISVWHQLSDVCAWGWNSACVRRFSALCVCENNSVHYKFEITVIPAWFALLCCQTVCAKILIGRQLLWQFVQDLKINWQTVEKNIWHVTLMMCFWANVLCCGLPSQWTLIVCGPDPLIYAAVMIWFEQKYKDGKKQKTFLTNMVVMVVG